MKEIQFQIVFKTEIIDTLSAVVMTVKDLPIFQFWNLKFDILPLRHWRKNKSLKNFKLKNNIMNLRSLTFL